MKSVLGNTEILLIITQRILWKGTNKSMRRIICVLITIMLVTLTSCTQQKVNVDVTENTVAPKTAGNNVEDNTYEKICEIDSCQLFFNENTTHFYIVDITTGKTFSSKSISPTLDIENSLFEITYIDEQGNLASMNSYADSVQKGQYIVEKQQNGIKIKYTLGDVQEKLYCPSAFSQERFEEILSKITDSFDKTLFKSNYYLADYSLVEDAQRKSELKSKYPSIDKESLYILRQDNLPLNTQREIDRILVSVGYNDDDYKIDVANSTEEGYSLYPIFNINLYVLIEDNKLVVKVPVSEIQELNSGTLVTLSLLRNFASPEITEEGYFILPDGSGSVMNYYSGKTYTQEYQVPVYGNDQSVQQEEEIYKQQQAFLPIFAKVYKDKAVFAEITDGDAIAEIKASPGSKSSCAVAYAMFNVRSLARSYLSSSTNTDDFFYIAQSKLYDGNLQVSYSFFDEENANMVDLANYYSSCLFGNKEAEELVNSIYIDFIGVAYKETSILGFKSKKSVVYTTLEQVKQIGEDLIDSGVNNLVFRLKGFFNEGLDSTAVNGVKLARGVGSTDDLNTLIRWCEDNDVQIYFDADVLYGIESGLFDGFSKVRDSSYLLTRLVGTKPIYNKATFELMDSSNITKYILHPNAVVNAVNKFADSASSMGIDALSFGELGSLLNSDYKKGREVERQNALKIIESALTEINKNNNLVVSGANAYLLPYSQHILDVPIQSSKYDITDASVPFLQMVLRGKVSYCDEALNMSGNTKRNILDAVGTNAGFHYIITANENENFQKTNHTDLCSTLYSVWKDDILEKSDLIKEVYQQTAKEILDYQILSDNVYMTVYDDGSYLICNYSNSDFVYEGISIDTMNYYIGTVRR